MDANEYFYLITLGWRDDSGTFHTFTNTGTYDVGPKDEVVNIFFKLKEDAMEEARENRDVAPPWDTDVIAWAFQPNTGLYRA